MDSYIAWESICGNWWFGNRNKYTLWHRLWLIISRMAIKSLKFKSEKVQRYCNNVWWTDYIYQIRRVFCTHLFNVLYLALQQLSKWALLCVRSCWKRENSQYNSACQHWNEHYERSKYTNTYTCTSKWPINGNKSNKHETGDKIKVFSFIGCVNSGQKMVQFTFWSKYALLFSHNKHNMKKIGFCRREKKIWINNSIYWSENHFYCGWASHSFIVACEIRIWKKEARNIHINDAENISYLIYYCRSE